MKLFVTGGTGFIGAYVLRALVNEGYKDIIAAKRPTSRLDLVQDIDGLNWVDCDLFDVVQLHGIISQCDAIIHMAGSVSFSPWKKNQIFKTNIDATSNLVNVALENDIKRFIHFSSVAALGLSTKTIDETKMWTENHSKSYYSYSKYLGEKEAWRGYAEGLNLSIISPSFTIGGGYWDYGPMNVVSRIDNGLKYYPSGSNGSVDVRDVADMCIRLLENSEMGGHRFICNGHNSSHLDLMSLICEHLGKPRMTTPLNGLLGTLAWRAASFSARLTGKETLLSKESYTISKSHLKYDNSKSIELLNMSYRPLEQTIKDTIDCYLRSVKNSKNFGILN